MINVIGLGYIGLPTALILAANGHEVVGTDIKEETIKILNDKKLTFKEDGLGELFNKAVNNGIIFSNEYQSAEVYIISVPTPYDKASKKVDMTYVATAFKSVLDACPENSTIVIESTVSPGSIDKYIRPLISDNTKKVRIAHAPERIIPGSMVYELEHNSRTIGSDDAETGELLKSF